MRARSFVTFAAASAVLTLTACFEDAPSSGVSSVTSANDDAGAQAAPAAPVRDPSIASIAVKSRVIDAPSTGDVADSGPSEDLDAQSDAGICGSGPSVRDEDQLNFNGNMDVTASQSPGQTFMIVQTGVLTGIELGLSSCNGVDPAASIVLTVSRGDTVVAVSSISAASISATACGGGPLSATEVGAGFFDLSGSCVAVTSGDELTAVVSISGATGACGPSNQCAGGLNAGNFCFSDEECQYSALLGIETDDAYDGGTMVVNGSTYGFDVSFKTFVR